MSSRRANNAKSMNNGNNNNGNNDNNGNNGDNNNSTYVNKHGVRVNVRYIPREGRFKPVPGNERPHRPVPSRGQRTHNPSLNGHIIYRSLPHMIKARRNKNETRRKKRILNAYRELQNARNPQNNTKRGLKAAKTQRRN